MLIILTSVASRKIIIIINFCFKVRLVRMIIIAHRHKNNNYFLASIYEYGLVINFKYTKALPVI